MSSGVVRIVPAGGNLQAAFDAAQPGDVIEIQAGATFTGNYVAPARANGTSYVWVRSSAWQLLAPQGTRVDPSVAGFMPKIVSSNNTPAIRFDFGAHGYYFTGIEVASSNAGTTFTNANLIFIGGDAAGNSAATLAQLPDRVIFDRCYIHGTATGNLRRGISAQGATFGVMDSYISDVHEVGADSQAVVSWTGAGPMLVQNSFLEGTGENVMFGGADTRIANLTPSDIIVRGNTIAWRLSWKTGTPWSFKNLFELKHAQRVLIEGNTFDTWWPAGQVYAIQFTVRNQTGSNPWAIVQDVTAINNRFRNILGNAVNILAEDSPVSGGGTSQHMTRVRVANNLFESISGDALRLLGGPINFTYEHNTVAAAPNVGTCLTMAGQPPSVGLIYRDNVVGAGNYLVFGDNTSVGDPALAAYAPTAIFTKNVIYGTPTSGGATSSMLNGHPGNLYPANKAAALNPDFSVTAPYKGLASDGTDPGVDLSKLPN
jgi:hypothetical protein